MTKPKNMTLLVLAAGMGSRYGGIKQIDGFGPSGETIMDYSLYDAVRAGFTKVVFIVREEILQIVKDRFEPKLRGKAEVSFVIQALNTLIPTPYQNPERTKPWGTGHAMLCAEKAIHEPFAVINADDFYGREAFQSLAQFFQHSADHAMVGYTLKNVLSDYGSVSRGCGQTDADGFLKEVIERTNISRENGKIIAHEKDGNIELNPDTPTSMNFWGFQPSIFELTRKSFDAFLKNQYQNIKSEFYIPLLVNDMIMTRQGKVKVIDGGKIWFGVTYQQDKEEVTQKIRALVDAGEYPLALWA